MKWYEILAVSIGLSLDVFAYALYKGAMISKMNWPRIAKMVAVFTVWQCGAMVLGSLISELPFVEAQYVRAEKAYDILSALLFFGVGVVMIVKSLGHREIIERRQDSYELGQLCAWAALTSIDSFLTGVSMGFLNTELTILILQLAVTGIVMVVAGIFMGYRIGCNMRYGALKLGGAILLAAGVDVLFRYYGGM